MINSRHPFWPRDASLFKGGSVGTPTTYAPPAPPTAANAAAVQASADARQKSLEKQGINSTLLAQQPGGAGVGGSANPLGGTFNAGGQQRNTLLGGG